jgi:hypothetical protein
MGRQARTTWHCPANDGEATDAHGISLACPFKQQSLFQLVAMVSSRLANVRSRVKHFDGDLKARRAIGANTQA